MDEDIMELDVLEGIFEGRIKPTDLKLSTLQSITANFSEERIIGTGGFGTVYKGVLRNGEVAVKRIKNSHSINEKVFRREVNSLLNVSHENIVRFLGFCSHTEHKVFGNEGSRDYIYAENRERILCFEYINNGSLEKYISDELRGLQWDTRFLIIKGICEGLQYLHTEKQIIHRDLKPANILIDYNMVAKITDFGLSRMEENAQTKTTSRVSSPGYTAPEYIDKGQMSVKYDVYSLGVIIIELVTGHRSIPDINNVLRRWSHRFHKSGKGTPFRYKQIAKIIDIGQLCQEKDPYNRPFISHIIRVINELESTDSQISNEDESTVGQISAYLEDDMLGIEPLELRFPFELNTQISCSLELTNETNASIAFIIQTTIPLPYYIQPSKGIVDPRSNYCVNITLQPIGKAPQDNLGDFIVRSTKANGSLKSEDITEDIFHREGGKIIDEVNLTVSYKAELPQVDVLFGSLIISDTSNLHGPQEPNEPATQEESKISVATSDEVIQFDPPELCFPSVPDKKVLSSFKIINVTEFYVSLVLSVPESNTAATYSSNPVKSILPPRSTQWFTLIREEKQDAVKDMPFNDEVFVRYAIVDEDIKSCDLDSEDHHELKNLPIVPMKTNSCTSNELIQFDPHELSFPCLNKTSLSSVNIVNITDWDIGFNAWSFIYNGECHSTEPSEGILPPRSTQRMVVKRVPTEKEQEDGQSKNNLFVWNMIVAEGVECSNIIDYYDDEDSKELPLICKKISPCTSHELIRLDHPGIRFTFSQNKTALSSVNMVNITDYYIGFCLFNGDTNTVCYQAYPELGILAPRSAQRVVIARSIKEKEPEDMQYKDKFFMWNAIVSEGLKTSDLDSCMSLAEEQSNELPISINKVTSSTSVEIIKFEPPEVRFPFLPRKRLSSSIKIVNNTDYNFGFNTRVEETNVALYITEPACGILPSWSTQELVITRVAKEEAPELEDMQCEDKYFVWSCFVTEDVKASDLKEWMHVTERKELPIVFTETRSNEFIQFDPPELFFPLFANQRALSSVKIVNTTDQYIGFKTSTKKSNSASYNANPSEGILQPLSTQVLMVTRIAEENKLEDIKCKDEFFMWNGIVAGDAKASDVIDYMPEAKCTKLPIVLTKSSSISNELIQFDPPELHFPFLPNKKVLSSIKIVNLTDCNVGFNTYSKLTNVAWYHTEPPRGILPPLATQKLMVTREEKEDALKDKQFNDKYFVWKSIVSKGVIDSDLSDYMSDQESTEVPIVPDKISSSVSGELIRLDPPQLCLPALLNKKTISVVNVVNTTDFYVAFHSYFIQRIAPGDRISVEMGILPPRSTEEYIISWTVDETELEAMEPSDDHFVWNRVVTEGVQSGDISSYMGEEESKKLYIILNKATPCTPDELIQFDPPELSLTFMPNKPLVFSFNIVNSTDYCVWFNAYNLEGNSGHYLIQPAGGIMSPRSTQRLVVLRTPKENEQDDMQCEEKLFLWSCLHGDGVKADGFWISNTKDEKGRKELPIAYKKTSLCTSDELIKFDPPKLPFPLLPNKRVPMLHMFKGMLKIVNVTDHSVYFRIWFPYKNSARYKVEPASGILPPQSTQAINVRRTLKEEETEDMQCKDKIFVWNGIVMEGVEESEVINKFWIYRNEEASEELPIVLTKPGESSSM